MGGKEKIKERNALKREDDWRSSLKAACGQENSKGTTLASAIRNFQNKKEYPKTDVIHLKT